MIAAKRNHRYEEQSKVTLRFDGSEYRVAGTLRARIVDLLDCLRFRSEAKEKKHRNSPHHSYTDDFASTIAWDLEVKCSTKVVVLAVELSSLEQSGLTSFRRVRKAS